MQHFLNAPVQPSTTHLEPPQIFLGGKVHISCVNCNFHFFCQWWLCNVSNFGQNFRISIKIQHYPPHRILAHKLYKPFQTLGGLIQAQDGMSEVNQWLCGCVVSNLRCPIFRMKQIKFWKMGQYTTHQWDCFVLHFTKVHPDLRSLYSFCVVHFEMLKKVFAYCNIEKLTEFFYTIPLLVVQGGNVTLQVIGDVWWHR